MRTTSLTARQAMNAQQTDEIFLMLLTITHDDLDAPLRFCNDRVNHVSRGETYVGYPFDVDLPADRDDQISQVTLTIDNVSREIVQTIRTLTSAPSIALEIVLASSPDTVEAGPFEFELQDASYDALAVTGTLGFEDILNEPYPGDSFVPSAFPGLWL